MTRRCRECGAEVEGRRRLCLKCRLAARRESSHRYELINREERNAARRETRAEGRTAESDEQVIDYTLPGAASKPPVFDIPRKPACRAPVTEVVDYTKGGHDAPVHEIRLNYENVANHYRRDRVLAARMAAAQQEQAREEPVTRESSLQNIQEALENAAHTVDFSTPATASSGPRYDHLGRPYRRQRRWG